MGSMAPLNWAASRFTKQRAGDEVKRRREERRVGQEKGQEGSGVVLYAAAPAVMHRLVGLRTAAGSRPKTIRVRRSANV